MQMQRMRIGMVAEEAGLAASTIRYYERIGLLPEPERESGRRQYGSSVSGQLRLIRSAKHAGFTLGEIQTLVHGFPSGMPPSELWQALSKQKIASVVKKIACMREMKSMLQNTLRCHCSTLEECASQKCNSGNDTYASLCCAPLPVRSAPLRSSQLRSDA